MQQTMQQQRNDDVAYLRCMQMRRNSSAFAAGLQLQRQDTLANLLNASELNRFESTAWINDFEASHVDVDIDPSTVFSSQLQRNESVGWAQDLKRTQFHIQPSTCFIRSSSNTFHQPSAAAMAPARKVSIYVPRFPSSSPTTSLLEKEKPKDAFIPSAPPSSTSNKRKRSVDAKAENDSTNVASSPTNNQGRVYLEPCPKDVLLGRGGRSNHHPGNQRYLEEKDMMQQRYLDASKIEKTIIAQELVDRIHAIGGRFLELDSKNGKWFEATNARCRKKCSQALREINTPEARAAKRAKYAHK